jgi:hypothetical protein
MNPADEELILRIGFSRPWDGKLNGWNPRRCYLQANGLICRRDNYGSISESPADRKTSS